MQLKRVLAWGLGLMWMGVIFYFSALPTAVIKVSEVGWQEFVIKKTAHMIEYGLLFALWYRVGMVEGWGRKKSALVAILVVAVYGGGDEFHQSFTPGREPRVRDAMIDVFGGVIAWTILWRLLPKMPGKLLNWAKKLQLV